MNEDQFIGRIMLLIVNNINSDIFIFFFQNFLLQIKAINIYENNKKKIYKKIILIIRSPLGRSSETDGAPRQRRGQEGLLLQ